MQSAALHQARQDLTKVRREAAALQGDAQMNSDLSASVDAVLRSPQVGNDLISYTQSDLASDHLKNEVTLTAATKAACARLGSCALHHVQDTAAKLGQTVQ
jgi:capsular polysaccharide biosynthesis protein